MNLNLDSVLFTSAAVGGKKAGASGLAAVEDYIDSEWKLTLLDADRVGFSASAAVNEDTGEITVTYSGATTGANEYISALITNSAGEVTHYGRLKGPTDASGELPPFTLPEGAFGTLYIFNEQYNGGDNDASKLTDYASPLIPVYSSSSIQLGTAGLAGVQKSSVWFGAWDDDPIKWRVLSTRTNTGGDGLFLLSDALLGTGDRGGVYFDPASSSSNAWQDSDAQAWCKDFAGESGAAANVPNAFTSEELGAILATTKDDGAFTSSTQRIRFQESDSILKGDKVFFLSAEEAEKAAYGFTNDNARIADYGDHAGMWWLRSPCEIHTYCAGKVSYDGSVLFTYVIYAWAARPAFNLDLNSVLFTSSPDGKKAGASGLAPVEPYAGSEWKLTLKDMKPIPSRSRTGAARRSRSPRTAMGLTASPCPAAR